MLPTSREIKKEALKNLRGKWPVSICVGLFPIICAITLTIASQLFRSVIPQGVPTVLLYVFDTLAVICLFVPLVFGAFRFFGMLQSGEQVTPYDCFAYFSSKKMYLRATKMALLVIVRLVILGFFLMLPASLTDFIAEGGIAFLIGDTPPIWFSSLWIISLFLRGFSIALLIVITLKYYMFPYIFTSNDGISVAEALRLSARVSYFGFSAFAGLIFSLSGWIVLSVLSLPAVFTLPYIFMCYFVHCSYAATVNNKLVKGQEPIAEEEYEFEI